LRLRQPGESANMSTVDSDVTPREARHSKPGSVDDTGSHHGSRRQKVDHVKLSKHVTGKSCDESSGSDSIRHKFLDELPFWFGIDEAPRKLD
jgi:hypothetical protein